MPLTINCGLSRKVSENYQSAGVSINVTAELDQSLLARPDELQQQIDDLYRQAHTALERQASAMAASNPQRQQDHVPTRTANGQHHRGHANGNGHRSTRPSNGRGGAPATDSQRRAINAIATRVGIDPQLEARDMLGVELDAMTIRQASELIDHLKSVEPAARNGNGRMGARH